MAVIAIITILASLLLPVLSKGKAQANCAECLSQLKQLQTGWQMYIGDNGDVTPPNFYDGESPPGSVVVGNAKTDSSTENIKSGVLYPYVNSAAVYHCPTDYSTVLGFPGLTRFRSYSLSGQFHTNPSMNGIGPNPVIRLSQITKTSRFFLFVDENESSIDDGVFGTMPYPSTEWNNLISDRHDQWANLTFIDGHAGRWRWRWPKIFVEYGQEAAKPQDLQDLRQLQNAIPNTF